MQKRKRKDEKESKKSKKSKKDKKGKDKKEKKGKDKKEKRSKRDKERAKLVETATGAHHCPPGHRPRARAHGCTLPLASQAVGGASTASSGRATCTRSRRSSFLGWPTSR